MLTTFFIVLPIFALIFAGFFCRRANILGPNATSELNRFVVFLALPALLFDIMAHTSWRAVDQPGFIALFLLISFIVYGNTGFIGFPLSIVLFGHRSLTLTTIAAVITVCILFAAAIILIEIGLQTETHPVHLARKVGRSLLRNPLLVSPALGAVWAATGLHLPGSAETFLKLLGSAASPCALVALGLFLGERRRTETVEDARPGDLSGSLVLVALKLLLQPALAWGLARFVFHLSPLVTHLTVVLAALPTGTGPFMLAEFYRREARVTANSILLSTIGSLFTITAYLAWVG